MDEILFFVILITILIAVLLQRGQQIKLFKNLDTENKKRFQFLYKKLTEIRDRQNRLFQLFQDAELKKDIEKEEKIDVEVVEKIIPEEVVEKIEQKEEVLEKEEIVEEKQKLPIEEIDIHEVIENLKKPRETSQKSPSEEKPPKEEKRKFAFPNFEEFISEHLSKIAIVILVLGLSFLVKYAIDEDWIGEIGRVGIGVLAGGILIALAHKLRKSYKAFSSVLIGGGLSILYFTIYIAFQDYGIIPSQAIAFVILVLITMFAVVLSILYDRQELAVLAILGGLSSPLMVSTGTGNYIVLFSYTALLNVGMLVLAYFKRWNVVNWFSYVCTIILFASWVTYTFNYKHDTFPHIGALLFATLFYVIFFLMNIINNVKEKNQFRASEISLLVSNTFLYYSAGMFILHDFIPEYKGMFTVLIAVFNFVFAYSLFKKVLAKKIDQNLVYLLIGLILTFISLAAPIQLEGNYITIFWASEAVLLLWLSQKTGLKIIRNSSVIVSALTIVSLTMDINNAYQNLSQEVDVIPFLDKLLLTGLFTVGAFTLLYHLLKKEQIEDFNKYIPLTIYRSIIKIAAVIFLYSVLLFEIEYQVSQMYELRQAVNTYLATYNFLFVSALMYYAFRSKSVATQAITNILAGILIFTYLFQYQLYDFTVVRNNFVAGDTDVFSFIFHYFAVVLAFFVLLLFVLNIRKIYGKKSYAESLSLWVTSFIAIFILSVEVEHTVVAIFGNKYEISLLLKRSQQIGYPIIWGISGFLLMIRGMKFDNKQLRLISLTIFSVTILKLFLVDVWEMTAAGKIASFIILGILLLVLSFLYQKLKKLIFGEEDENN